MGALKVFGNVIWILFGGVEMFLFYLLSGLLSCITLIGIPYGMQMFKLSLLALWPFGKEVVDDPDPTCGPVMSVVLNIVCIIFSISCYARPLWIALHHYNSRDSLWLPTLEAC